MSGSIALAKLSTMEDPEDPTEVDQKVGLSRNRVHGSNDKRRSSISIDDS
jgi:hypothetical protein